ncbi:DUF5358 family protein [Haemophilus haemolyticus]|uniref:DUF5358 family protein n=1 Tax=Haemophilus haemolyticus TaxID=726 RepID=UPI000E56F359|nr:DUF5358 family protein [Haemophilus haemolyticus]
MFKKTLSVFSIFVLTACGSSYQFIPQQPKYKISDEDMKEVVSVINKLEHCIHPELKGLTLEDADRKVYRKYSQEERILWNNAQLNTIVKVIGERDSRIIANDPASQAYFSEQHKKFNNNIANVDVNECKAFKRDYNNAISELRKQIQEQKKQAIAKQKAAEQQRKAQQIQAEKERKAREAYLKTPQGQAELARQQQAEYQRQMLAQQREYQQQMLEMQRQAAQQAAFQEFSNSISSGFRNMNQQIQQGTQFMNQMNQNMRSSCQSIGNGWGTGGWTNVCN